MQQLRQQRRQQHGFIQGAILFALALIVVIIAAFAAANNSTSSNTDIERDRAHAAVIIKASIDVQTAVDRAVADGNLLANIQPVVTPPANQATTVALYNPALGYGTPPVIPPTAIVVGGAAALSIVQLPVGTLGTQAGNETVLLISGLTQAVCQRADVQLNGGVLNLATAPAIAPINTNNISGCFNSGTALVPVFSLYRVLATT